MKFGYLREDNDGHQYIIPEDMLNDYSLTFIKSVETKVWDTFEEKFGEYKVEGELYSLRIVMEG